MSDIKERQGYAAQQTPEGGRVEPGRKSKDKYAGALKIGDQFAVSPCHAGTEGFGGGGGGGGKGGGYNQESVSMLQGEPSAAASSAGQRENRERWLPLKPRAPHRVKILTAAFCCARQPAEAD